jgi:KDO2-lipid IV(A) lauroyltransferase
MYHVTKKRRKIADTNLRLCFPEYSPAKRQQLLHDNFKYMGLAVLETGLSWWGNPARLPKLGRIVGMHHLEKALQQRKGVILLSGHMTSTDLGGKIIGLALANTDNPLQVMYKPAHNLLINTMMVRGREQQAHRLFKHRDIRSFVRGLQENMPSWYAPDQDFGLKQSVFADFFGVPTATLTVTARIAAKTGAAVVPYFPIHLDNGKGFEIRILPAWKDYPSGDDVVDAQRVNTTIEKVVRKYPAQYLWMHRRFKTRPKGHPPVYET